MEKKLYTGYVLYPSRKWNRNIQWPLKDVFQGMIETGKYTVEEIDVHAYSYLEASYELILKLYEEYEKGAEAVYLEERLPEVQIFKIG